MKSQDNLRRNDLICYPNFRSAYGYALWGL